MIRSRRIGARWRTTSWWRTTTQWIVERPKAVAAALGALGLLTRHAWLTNQPLSAGDWHWPSTQRFVTFFPWPGIWDPTLGLGGENRFLEAFRFPLYSINGLLARLGIDWSYTEKLLYFIPYAVLLPVAGWVLAREVVGRSRWALLTPALLLGSTYFILEADGEIPLTLAEAISLLVLTAFLRAMRHTSLAWALVTGLGLGIVAAFDVRPAFLTAILMGSYLAVLSLAERAPRRFLRRLALCAAAGAVFVGTQAFWIVPLLTYRGNPGFPTPEAPNFNILTLGHGVTGVSAFWSGGQPAALVQASLNPAFTVLPILAMLPLLARRLRPETVWLAAIMIAFAFLAKTNTPPLGGVYDWMYVHVPGWKLFREGSKFLYCVVVAYSLLIPIALRAVVEHASILGGRRQTALRSLSAAVVIGVVALCLWPVFVLERGDLGSTTHPTPEPSSFAALSKLLEKDARPGAVLYFGQPLITIDSRNHHFLIASSNHPAVNLTGDFNNTKVNRRDPFQIFCPNAAQPFCYVAPQLFPYLLRVAEAGYVVVPGGTESGSLPAGITRTWLRDQVTGMLGPPMRLGTGATQLLVWRVADSAPVVSAYPAVALVDSGPWSTGGILPALEAMNAPAAYRQTFDRVIQPAAAADLPGSIVVVPHTGGACTGTKPLSVAVMARTTASSLDVYVGGTAQRLPVLATSPRLPEWGFYGPVSLPGGRTRLAASGPGMTEIGPCVEWSAFTARVLGAPPPNLGDIRVTSNGERIVASTVGDSPAWVELRRYYDPGWRLAGARPSAVGDGLFSLYHTGAAASSGTNNQNLVFQFSTVLWERVGQGLSAVALLLTIGLAAWDFRRRRRTVTAEEQETQPLHLRGRLAQLLAAAGLLLLSMSALAVALEWFGVPSVAPVLSLASDPYSLDIGYAAAALAFLGASILTRCIEDVVASSVGARMERVSTAGRMGVVTILLLVTSVLLSSCGGSAANANSLLAEAQQAGQVSPSILGSSLDDARLQRAARQPDLCIADYTEALKTFVNLASAYAGRGACYLNGGQNAPAAVHDFTRAISLSPQDPDLFLSRAVADRASGDQKAAIVDYSTAANIPSATPDRLLTAIDGLVAIGRPDTAESVFRTAVSRFPTAPSLHLGAADIALATDQDGLAADELATAQRLSTTDDDRARVFAHLCHHELLRQNYIVASGDCAQAASLSSDGSGSFDDLSSAHLALGQVDAALLDIGKAIGAFTGGVGPSAQAGGVSGFGLAVLYEARGFIEINLRRPDAAIADFHRAENVLPSTAPDERARLRADIATASTD